MASNPTDLNNGGTALGADKKAENDAIERGDDDAMLEAHDRQQEALHPTASDTPDVGNASESQNLND